MDIAELEKILRLLRDNEVSKFELQREGTTLRVSRTGMSERGLMAGAQSVELEPAIISPVNGQGPGVASGRQGAAEAAHLFKVESPIVGTFYRKPSPDAEAFVKEGARVAKGDTLCIVEAMKLMNEIEAPCSGVVERILLEDGQVVEFGEVLFLINTQV